MARYEALLSPFRLKHLELKNRVISTAHAPGYAEGGSPGEQYQRYHEEKARGGLALTMFGGSSNIAPESGSIYGQIYVGHDAIVSDFKAFARRIHRHGAALMCQISHMGRRTVWDGGDWLPTLAPSALRDPAHGAMPAEIGGRDIARIVKAFGQAARRCRDGDLDGVEILANTHLIGQFLSPLSNRRDDAYGGTPERRARFLMEVLEEVRERVGPDFIVGVRMTLDESNEDGLAPDACIDLARAIAATGQVDFLNVNGAYGGTTPGLSEAYPTMGFPSAPYLPLAKRAREATGLPILQAARIADPATADFAIAEGYLDLVGMTRAHMTDPHLVAKLARGEEARIRPCVGAGYCIDRAYAGKQALCLHNAATGRESHLPHLFEKAPRPLKVVVVGGGPAGLEAARVSAERGHAVVLFEAAERLGGQVVLAAQASWRKDLIGITDWLAAEVDELGVALRRGHLAEASDIAAEAPDVVIMATGGLPNMTLPEGGEDLAVSGWDLLAGQAQVEDRVLLYEDHGDHQGPSTALALAERGVAVELVTPHRMIGRQLGGLTYPSHLKRLYALGVVMTPDHALVGLKREGNALVATLRNAYTRQRREKTTDHVVLEQGTLPADDLFHAVKDRAVNLGETDLEALAEGRPQALAPNPAGDFRLYRVGDCISSRNLHAALLDSLRLCATL